MAERYTIGTLARQVARVCITKGRPLAATIDGKAIMRLLGMIGETKSVRTLQSVAGRVAHLARASL